MTNKVKYISASVSIIFALFIFQTCKKDYDKCLECDKCRDFPKPKGTIVGGITQKSLQKAGPCFNPNNPNEFIYVKTEDRKIQLIKYNIESKSEVILLDNAAIVGQPKWGKNGLIVFSKLDLKIYIVKDNGDSLRRLTSFFENIYPSFLGDDKIFFCIGAETSPGAGGNKIIDLYGTRLDSLKSSDLGACFGMSSVNANMEIVSWIADSQGKCYMKTFSSNLTNFNTLYEFQFTGRKEITGLCWHPNNDDIYFSMYREGIFKLNKNSKKLVKVRNGCDSRSYRYLSISPDWKKILVERVDATDYQNTDGNWTEEAKIYIMDINGKNEKDVFE